MSMFLTFLGGLGLLLFGMSQMSEGLRKAAGKKARQVLEMLTGNVFKSVGVGALVTCIIQSSSATTVMVVGFVNAGLLRLRQAIGTIMGANIGTTITAWLISLFAALKHAKISRYGLPMVGIGFIAHALARRNGRNWGQALLGLGLIILGLGFMKDAFGPLCESGHVSKLFTFFGQSPFWGFLAGALMTAVLQSSSATIGIAQLLAATGVLSLDAALPIVIGDNVGTTITANLAAIGANTNARRAAIAHFLFNVFGYIYLPFIAIGLFQSALEAVVPGELGRDNIAVHIAAAHTAVNVLSTLIFMPLAGRLERLVVYLVPSDGDEMIGQPQFLEKHLLDTPVLALDSAKKEILRMMEIASNSVANAMAALTDDKGKAKARGKAIKRVDRREEAIDQLQGDITNYLVEISSRDIDLAEANEFPVLIHVVNDIERIGDHAVNLAELAQTYMEERLSFSKAAARDIKKLKDEVDAMMAETVRALEDNDREAAAEALKREMAINDIEIDCRKGHAVRLARKKCEVQAGLVFLDVITNMEKIGDHLANIDQAVMGAFQWGRKFRLRDEDEPGASEPPEAESKASD